MTDASSKTPKVVYVGPADYDVTLVKKLDLMGETDSNNTEILLRLALSPSAARGTLVHELLHAVLFESGLDKHTFNLGEPAEQERLVAGLAPWIYAVFFLDNPDLTAYLSEQRKDKAA